MLNVTFNSLRRENACSTRYKVLAKALGGVRKYGRNTPIPLEKILDTNGFYDALWALRATVEDSSQFSRLLTCDFAEHVLPKYEKHYPADKRPRQSIETARLFANGLATQAELSAAGSAAGSAAWAAAESAAAWSAAWSAGSAAWAAELAAESAAESGAWAAGSAAGSAEITWQTQRFQELLLKEV